MLSSLSSGVFPAHGTILALEADASICLRQSPPPPSVGSPPPPLDGSVAAAPAAAAGSGTSMPTGGALDTIGVNNLNSVNDLLYVFGNGNAAQAALNKCARLLLDSTTVPAS